MKPTPLSDSAPQDPAKVVSRKVVDLHGGSGGPLDELGMAAWIERYLALAVTGVRSAEVATKIRTHLERFRAFLTAGLGDDRVDRITAREVTLWRDHLLAAGIVGKDGATAPMAAATVGNHLAHLSGFFTWTAAQAAARGQHRLLPFGNPAAKVDPPRLPALEPRALSNPQRRVLKNVLDRAETYAELTGRAHRGAERTMHRHARPLRDRAIGFTLLATGLRRAELVGLDLDQLEPNYPDQLRQVKKARLRDVRGKGRSQRHVYLSLDARQALADYLEDERIGDVDEESTALFLAASSINNRRPGGRLSPRSINTIVAELGRRHDGETGDDPERQLGKLRPHDLRHDFAYRLSEETGHNAAELERRLGHGNGRYLKVYTNPPGDIAAGYIEDF
ncbi:MAG TPA: tyrosine-type recombinase/integrase [Nonomuraea sp.]|nr:tyrosine-type recombinase/integrase [Nonomuraea sp.]